MQYIILLRGINVGGRNIKMTELKSCLENRGYKKVITVLQTGNVILESQEKSADKVGRHVEKQLSEAFNYPAKVLVVTPSQLKAIIEHYPFSNFGPEFHRYAVFTKDGYEKELLKQQADLDKAIEDISAGNGVLYWRVVKGSTLDSLFGKYMSKAAAKHFLTNRNLNTLEKVLIKCHNISEAK